MMMMMILVVEEGLEREDWGLIPDKAESPSAEGQSIFLLASSSKWDDIDNYDLVQHRNCTIMMALMVTLIITMMMTMMMTMMTI